MKIRAMCLSIAAGIWASASTALPVQWTVAEGGNGHWYEFVLDWDATWSDAQAAAAAAVYNRMSGYLVTITSAAENTFVRALATAQYPFNKPTNIHIGASDAGTEGSWVWGSGEETGEDLVYNNWKGGSAPAVWADYAMMDTRGRWFGSNGFGAPYVIEYSEVNIKAAPSVPLPASGLLMLGALGLGTLTGRRRTAATR